MQYEHLEVDIQGAVAWVTLNRPERLNALNPKMIAELSDFFDGLRADAPVRVVILRGAGRAFCAGLDLKDFQSGGARKGVGEMLEFQRKVRDIMIAMRRCPQPVISIVNGSASGGGFALALASDIRLATADARMNASFIRLGLSGCDVGVTALLRVRGRLRRIARYWETESQITKPYSEIVLRLPAGTLEHLRRGGDAATAGLASSYQHVSIR